MDQGPGLISITKEEASSQHVDDMLQRQKNMRGEAGMRRKEGRSWFLQNWFVFAIVGAIGAVLAWAIIEPIMHDIAYFQGEIKELTWYEQTEVVHFPEYQKEGLVMGELKIRDNKLRILAGMRDYTRGTIKELEELDIKTGDTVGLYAQEAIPMGLLQEPDAAMNIQPQMVAVLIDSEPPVEKAADGSLDIATYRQHSSITRHAFFAIIAGLIGLFLGSADGLICRQPRRAFLCGSVGLIVGLLGGFVSGFVANIIFSPLSRLAMTTEGAGGEAIMVAARALGWAVAGLAMGLGQGIALRSKKLVLYGLVGGIIGGLLGGLLFDPITWMNTNEISAHLSRFFSVLIIGLSVGLMIGIVELLARDAWLRMTQGPLAGKEFLVFKDVMYVGASPRSDIYLFNDDDVADTHAALRSSGDICEIEAASSDHDVMVNNRAVKRSRLRPGDQITIGKTMFTYQERKR